MLGRLNDREVAEKLNRTTPRVRDRPAQISRHTIPAANHAPKPVCIEREPRDHYASHRSQVFALRQDEEGIEEFPFAYFVYFAV